jgi:hypothetical protein
MMMRLHSPIATPLYRSTQQNRQGRALENAHALASELRRNLPSAPDAVKAMPKNLRQGIILSALGLSIVGAGVVGSEVLKDFKETEKLWWIPLIPADFFGLQLLLKATMAFGEHHLPRLPKNVSMVSHLDAYGKVIPQLRDAIEHIQYALNQAETPLPPDAAKALQARLLMLKHCLKVTQTYVHSDDPSRLSITSKDLYRRLGLTTEWQAIEATKPKKGILHRLINGETWINNWWLNGVGKRPFKQHLARVDEIIPTIEVLWAKTLKNNPELQKQHRILLGHPLKNQPLGYGELRLLSSPHTSTETLMPYTSPHN